ncbi:MAG: carboxypeptidase-like regulatory domain-containing protein [Bryobacteraceae bacterium]
MSIEHDQGTVNDLAQRAAGSIAGTVVDKSGAVIPGAKVTLKNEANDSFFDGVTNGSGVFSFPAILPGSYTATIAAPGLQTYELQHIVVTQGAAVGIPTIPLQVATTAEAIEITASGDVAVPIDSPQASQTLNQNMIRDLAVVGRDAAELMKIMPGTAMAGVPPPPPRTAVTTGPPPPTLTTVTIGKCKLTVDPSGALLLSRDAGRHWKAVKPLWQGKAARLAIANEQAAAAGFGLFQLTTESGSVWLSRDGTHWYSVPAQH